MMNVQKIRFAGETALASICAALALLTIVCPDWIERLLGTNPDSHNGIVEWSMVLGLCTVAVVCATLARFEWNRSLRRV